jgi:hypothetical protein
MMTGCFIDRSRHVPSGARIASLAAAMALLTMTSAASAQQAYKSAEDAATALVEAVRTGERRAILTVLGRGGADIVSSGDAVADDTARQIFLEAYDVQHQISMESDSKAIMVIGQVEFPFPIPIVRKDAAWRFDTAAGRLEILFRRIGRNELNTIQACLAYVDAQNEYAEADRTGAGGGVYPAEYGNSGVMTLLVSHAGNVYEKDLGPRTSGLAERMAVFNPDQTWKIVTVTEEPVQ